MRSFRGMVRVGLIEATHGFASSVKVETTKEIQERLSSNKALLKNLEDRECGLVKMNDSPSRNPHFAALKKEKEICKENIIKDEAEEERHNLFFKVLSEMVSKLEEMARAGEDGEPAMKQSRRSILGVFGLFGHSSGS